MQGWWLINLYLCSPNVGPHFCPAPQTSSMSNKAPCAALLLYYKACIWIWDNSKQCLPITCKNWNYNNKNGISCSSCLISEISCEKGGTYHFSLARYDYEFLLPIWWDAKALSHKSLCTAVSALLSRGDRDGTRRNSKVRKSEKQALGKDRKQITFKCLFSRIELKIHEINGWQ